MWLTKWWDNYMAAVTMAEAGEFEMARRFVRENKNTFSRKRRSGRLTNDKPRTRLRAAPPK